METKAASAFAPDGRLLELFIADLQTKPLPINGKHVVITGLNGAGKTFYLRKLETTLVACKKAQAVATTIIFVTWLGSNVWEAIIDKNPSGLGHPYWDINQSLFIPARNPLKLVPCNLNVISKINPDLAQKFKATYDQILAVFHYEKIPYFYNQKLSFGDVHANDIFSNDLGSQDLIFNDYGDRPAVKFEEMSHGQKVIFAILQRRMASLIKNQSEKIIIIWDDFEVFLHPFAQKQILGWINQWFPTTQFILITHSPFVVASALNRKKWMVLNLERNLKNEVILEPLTKDHLATLEALGVNELVCDFAFADLVLLVEGPTDKRFFEKLFSTSKNNEKQVHIIAGDGVNNFVSLVRSYISLMKGNFERHFFNKMIVIHDGDPAGNKTAKSLQRLGKDKEVTLNVFNLNQDAPGYKCPWDGCESSTLECIMLKFINDHGGHKDIKSWHSNKKHNRVKTLIRDKVENSSSNDFEKFFKNLKDSLFKLVEKG